MPNDDTISSTVFSDAVSDAGTLNAVMIDLEARSQRFGAALTSALAAATTGGKGLDAVLTSLAGRLADISLSAGLKPLETALSGGIDSLLGSASTALAGAVTPFADGGVVRSPAYFPLQGGSSSSAAIGLMGEAGAEAILPLQRGADGTLGVASGGGDSGAPPIVFNVTATDAASFRKSEGQLTAMLARSVGRGRRGL